MRSNIIKRCVVDFLVVCSVVITGSFIFAAQNWDVKARIESVRNDNILVLLSPERLQANEYLLVQQERVVGKVIILEQMRTAVGNEQYYRCTGRYTIDSENGQLLRAGVEIALRGKDTTGPGAGVADYTDRQPVEKIDYLARITSPVDRRQMVLVPGGTYYIGTDDGAADQRPRHKVVIDTFYIDRCEVSNADYRMFVRATGKPAPASWKNVTSFDDIDLLPVQVSYQEALGYANWAGKRLPTEEEWEKAAGGIREYSREITPNGYLEVIESTLYPWGNLFGAAKCNTEEFWEQRDSYVWNGKTYRRGLLPVDALGESSASAFGALHMIGNAMEWTSSWYKAYPGSTARHERFGQQVKVVRGGAWYSTRGFCTNSSRQFAGIPNLYEDNSAGFRCVKKPDINDRR